MKRKLTVLLTVLMVLALVMGITVACNPSNQPTNKVPAGPEGGTYYCDDGSDTYYISLKDGSKFTFDVSGENREGDYEFAGTMLTLKFSETETVSAELRDYNEMTFTYKNKNYTFLRDVDYTVSFDSQGSAVTDRNVKNGRVLEEPNSPTKSGYFFAGWYEDAQYKTRFNFGTRITENKTLYGKFVEAIAADPEYTVTFVTGEGATQIDPMQTTGGMIDVLSLKPTKSGAEFLGWWVSHENDPNKLTYKYELERLYEDTTFYAVWSDGTPAVSVKDGEATWTGTGEATVEVTNPDGSKTNPTVSGNKATIAFNATGEYQIKVTVGGKTTTAYYTHNRISRVSVFKTDGDLLQFYKVPEADSYEVTLTHKDGKVTLSTQDGGTSDILAVDFGSYDIPADGYVFTVTASAAGRVSSVSEYTFNRVLDKVTGFNVDNDSQLFTWTVVEGVRYDLKITLNGDVKYEGVTNRTSYDFIEFDRGEIKVEITPIKAGWNSPEAAVYTYDKLKLSGVKNIEFGDNDTITWDEVEGAMGYKLTINGVEHTAVGHSFQLRETYLEGADSLKITIRATSSNPIYDSPESEEITVVAGKMGNVYYDEGILSWDAVFGVRRFGITINEEPEIVVTTKTNSAPVRLVAKHNHITVRIIKDNFNASSASTDVEAYEISFDRGFVAEAIPPLYKAEGDPISFQGITYDRYGYDFNGWFDNETGLEYIEDMVFDAGRDVVLSARWTPHVITSLKLDVNGGSDDVLTPPEITFDSDDYVLPVPETNRDEYAFEGWYAGRGGSDLKMTDEKGNALRAFVYDGETTFYARWVVILVFEDTADGHLRVSQERSNISLVTEVTIPETHDGKEVTEISDFTNNSIVTLNIPATINAINLVNGASFKDSNRMLNINVNRPVQFNGTPVFSSIGGVLFRNDLDGNPVTLVHYPKGRLCSDTEYTVPSGTKEIAGSAFYSYQTATLNTRPKILATINIPATVSVIDTDAFINVNSLTTLNCLPVADNEQEADGLEIRAGAISGNNNITTLNFPRRLTDISLDILSGIKTLTDINVESGGSVYFSEGGLLYTQNETYGKELVFYPFGREGVFTIPATVRSIGPKAFNKNTALTSVTISAQVQHIGESAFEGCSHLASVTFLGKAEDDELIIEKYAFYGRNADITSLVLPENLAEIGEGAFGFMPNLTDVTLNTKGRDLKVAAQAFMSAKSDTPTGSVKNLHLGEFVSSFGITEAFGVSLEKIDIQGDNKNYYLDSYGALYNADMDELLFFPSSFEGEYAIPAGVTEIGAEMFRGRDGLTKVTIHANVVSIGERAFYGCAKLATVVFEEGGSSLVLGDQVFSNCSQLSDIRLPNHLKEIGVEMFNYCTSLTSINIPASVELIKLTDGTIFRTFNQCNKLTTITIEEGNLNYIAKDDIIYSVRETLVGENIVRVPDILLYCPTAKVGKVTIDSSVRMVAGEAFRNCNLVTEVYFNDLVETKNADEENPDDVTLRLNPKSFYNDINNPDGIREIRFPVGLREMGLADKTNGSAINSLRSLTKINVPNTVATIRYDVVSGCSALSEVIFDEGGDTPLRIEDQNIASSGSMSSGNGAFSHCPELKSVTLPARLVYLGTGVFSSYANTTSNATTYIEEVHFTATQDFKLELNGSFTGNKTLKTVELQEGLDKITSSAFSYTTLKSINIPASTTELGGFSFSSIETVTVSPDSKLTTIASSAFYEAKKLRSFEIPASVKDIQRSAFSGCVSLSDLKLMSGSVLETIGETAFNNCAFSSISLPKTLKTIGSNAFAGVNTLSDLTFESDENGVSDLQEIQLKAFANTSIKRVIFPESSSGKLTLGVGIFSGCSQIDEVYLSNSIEDLSNVFSGCSVKTVRIDDDNPNFTIDTENSIVYNKAGDRILFIYADKTGTMEIPKGTTTIDAGAFKGVANLENIVIPASVNNIGASAFEGCINLKTVTFEIGCVLDSIGERAFQNCTSLQAINFINTPALKTIGFKAFQGCSSLKSVNFGETEITSFGNQVFSNCGFETLDLGKAKITALPQYMFAECHSLREVTLPETIKTLNNYCFSTCEALRTVRNLDKVSSFGTRAFEKCGFRTITLYGTDKDFGSNLFADCASLVQVLFDDATAAKITTLASSMFSNCTSLQDIEITKLTGLTQIASSAFKNTAIRRLDLKQCAALQKIDANSFQNCTKLTTCDLSNSTALTTVGNSAFSGCVRLTGIDLSNSRSLKALGNNCFENCSELSSVNLSGSINYLGTYTFQNCTSLERIDLSRTALTCIGTSATAATTSKNAYTFTGCTALTEVLLPDGCVKLAGYVFDGCTSLTQINLSGLNLIGNYCFNNTGFTSVTIPASLSATGGVGTYAFANCVNLRSVNAESGANSALGTYMFANCENLTTADLSGTGFTALANYFFSGCSALSDVRLPDTINYLGTYAFQNCTALERIDLSSTKIERFSSSATANVAANTQANTFLGCTNLTTVRLPASLVQIGGYTFRNCVSLKEIDLSHVQVIGILAFENSGVSDINLSALTTIHLYNGASPFAGGNISNIDLGSNNNFNIQQLSVSGFNSLRDSQGKVYLTYSASAGDKDLLDLSENTELQPEEWLGMLSGYKKVILPKNLTAIPNYAFYYRDIEEIVLPEGLQTIGNYAFSGSSLHRINLPEGLQSIGTNAFQNTTIETIELPETLESIGNYAFDGSTIATINIKPGLKTIGDYSFRNATIKDVVLPETVTSIGKQAFAHSTLENITISASVTTIGQGAFIYCGNLDTVTFEEGDEDSTPITLTAGLTFSTSNDTNESSMGVFEFSAIKNVKFSDRVDTITIRTFKDTANLASIEFGGVTSIANHAFYRSGIKTFEFPEDVDITLGNSVFALSAIQTLTIPANIIVSGTNTFQGCSDIDTVEFTGTVEYTTLSSTFKESSVKNVVLPEGLTTLSNTFQECTSLRTVKLPETLTEIGASSFTNCTAIEELVVPSGVTTIAGNSATDRYTTTSPFFGWTSKQRICFRNSNYLQLAIVGTEWKAQNCDAQLIFDYSEE